MQVIWDSESEKELVANKFLKLQRGYLFVVAKSAPCTVYTDKLCCPCVQTCVYYTLCKEVKGQGQLAQIVGY